MHKSESKDLYLPKDTSVFNMYRRPNDTKQRWHENGVQPSPKLNGGALNMSKEYSRISQRHVEEIYSHDKVVKLQQRLKNVHYFYHERLNQQRTRNSQKNDMIIDLIEELENNHSEKIKEIQRMIEEAENEKRDVNFVDERMTGIRGNIDELIKKSTGFKESNKELEQMIRTRQASIREKEPRLEQISSELIEARKVLESFELGNLRQNKQSKELLQLLNSAPRNPL